MSKKIKLICIGAELLNGFTEDQNFSWLAKNVSLYNAELSKVSFIEDSSEAIKNEILSDHKNFDTIIISGGLGPTPDDVTKAALASLLNQELRFSESFLKICKNQYSLKNREYDETNYHYHYVPDSFEPLINLEGYAPGIRFSLSNTTIYALPGVPSEFRSMVTHSVFNAHREHSLNIKVMRTHGVSEKLIFDKIDPTLWEKLTEVGKLSCLPYHSGVDLRLEMKDTLLKEEFDKEVSQIIENSPIKGYVWSFENIALEKLVARLLIESQTSISFVESCTGGLLSHLLTQVSGISQVLKGSIIPYQTPLKPKLLDIPKDLIESKGVVSKEVAIDLAKKGLEKMDSDICLSTTGFASQVGDQFESGSTVHLALTDGKNIIHQRFSTQSHREINKLKFAYKALHMIREYLQN